MTVPVNVPDFFTLPEVGRILRIGRNSAYKAAIEFENTGGESGLPVVKVGKLKRVPRLALEAILGGPITWPLVEQTTDGTALTDDEAELPDRQEPERTTAEDPDTVERRSMAGPDQQSLPFEG